MNNFEVAHYRKVPHKIQVLIILPLLALVLASCDRDSTPAITGQRQSDGK